MLDSTQSSSHFIHRLASPVSFLLLLLLPILGLDTRELSADEARFVQGQLGPLEHEFRVPAEPVLPPALGRLMRGWATLVGTTERPLKMLALLMLWIAAILSAEAARDRAGARGWQLAILGFAAALSYARDHLLDPQILGALPGAAALGLALFSRRGSPLWLALAIAGAGGASLLSPSAGWGFALGGVVALAISLGGGTRSRLRGLLGLAIGLGAAWFCKPFDQPLTPVGIAAFGFPWVAWALAVLAAPSRRRSLVVLGILIAAGLAGQALSEAAPGRPMRDLLDHAARLAKPGGRLVVAGPLRHGILFYSRRGHDPAIPILLVPEDTSETELPARLKEAVGSGPQSPEILISGLSPQALTGVTVIAREGDLIRARLP